MFSDHTSSSSVVVEQQLEISVLTKTSHKSHVNEKSMQENQKFIQNALLDILINSEENMKIENVPPLHVPINSLTRVKDVVN